MCCALHLQHELARLRVAIDGIFSLIAAMTLVRPQYEFGDLSIEIDKRTKEAVAQFCGKDSYQIGEFPCSCASGSSSLGSPGRPRGC